MPLTLEQIVKDSPLTKEQTIQQIDLIAAATVSIQNIYKGMEEGNVDFSIDTAAVLMEQIIIAKKNINQPTAFDEACLKSLQEMPEQPKKLIH